ncbi:MAG: ROK family protein [Bacteroidetes bacterium]|nr:ROK family protein [Bacteroidota bacterium]MCL5737072.1 ROK family protein [Bacteroidota bacterium]
MNYIIGVDLGGTYIKAGVVSKQGELLYETSLPSKAEVSPQAVVGQIAKAVETIKDKYKGDELLGVGIGSPGMVDLDGGTVKYPPNFANWTAFRLGEETTKKTGARVEVENDANAAAVGELKFGAGKGLKNFIMITLGTGVGGGFIIDGKIFRGEQGGAGEIGHTTINYNGPLCNCGNHGCVEAHVGQRYLSRRVAEQLKSHPESLINKLINGDTEKLEPKIISQAAEQGDKFALQVWQETGMYIGVAVASAFNLFDVATLIVGGGVAKAGRPLFDSIEETIKLRALTTIKQRTKILHAQLENSAGILGAAALIAE